MPGILFVAAPWWAGIRHRFLTINHAVPFARAFEFQLYYIWGVSEGVSFCPFKDLLAPVPNLGIVDLHGQELKDLEKAYKRSAQVCFRGHMLDCYRPGGPITGKMLAFDLLGDLAASNGLLRAVPMERRVTKPVIATPSPTIRKFAEAQIQRHNLRRRVGIRVRVTESPADGRKPRRLQQDLDQTVKALARLPWYLQVFLVTDSEYVQQMLASHFFDARFLPKRFGDTSQGGRYVHRTDPFDMKTFVSEVVCLSACWKIINVGGFINEEHVYSKIIGPPYDQSLGSLRSMLAAGAARR